MIKNLLFVLLSVFTISLFGQCVTNVNFNTWQQGGHPGNGNWSVQSGGSQVYQSINGAPTFFLSPNNLMNVHISGNFRTIDSDDDWMGFVFSYLNPMTGIDTFDCWLFDWKQDPQDGASDGMSLCRVNGVIPPSNYTPTFWNHTNSPEFTVMQNNFGSGGWNTGTNHAFELYLTFTRAMIYVDGNLVFDQQDCFKPGRFGFYNYSQSDCIYSNFQYDLFVDFDLDDQACTGQTVDVEFVSPCAPTSLNTYQTITWDFGDGTVITNTSPTYANVNKTHVYSQPGIYNVTLTVTDIGGCTSSKVRTIDVRNPITLAPSYTQPLCNNASNGAVSVTPSGGFGNFSYSWNGGAHTGGALYSGIPAGSYNVSVTDGVCSASGTYVLSQPTQVTASVSSTNASCGANNGTATITISGGTPPYQGVTWAGNAATAQGGGSFIGTGLAAGTYIANFQDANGCSALLQYSATIGSLPCGYTLSKSSTHQTCAGVNNGTATVTVTGGVAPITITWSNGGSGATITGLAPGNYTYNYNDGNAQNFTGSVTVNAAVPMAANVTTIGVSCAGAANGQALASVTAGGNSPFTYAWSGGGTGPSKTGLSPGAVTVTITDATPCSVTASGIITTATPIAVTMQTIYDSCYHAGGGAAIAHVSGGSLPYAYSWSNFETDSSNLGIFAGNYTLTVTDQAGCTTTSTAVVGGAPPLTKTRQVQNITCNGASTGSIVVTPAGGTQPYNYTWNPANLSGPSQQNLAAGIYSFTVTDTYGCQLYGTDTLSQPATVLAATTSHTNVTCNGANNGTITINVSGGTPPYSFLGNPVPAGTTTIPNLAPNTYAGNLLDANNCSVALSETITQPAAIVVNIATVMDSCFQAGNGSATVQVSGGTTPYGYIWTNGVTTASNPNLLAGSYSVTVTDASTCSVSSSGVITQGPQFTFTNQKQDVTCNGASTGSVTLTPAGGTPPYSYTWNPAGTNAPNQQNLPAGNYQFTISDSYNCQQTGSETVSQPTALVATTSSTNVTCNGANNGTITINVSGGTAPYSFLGNPVPAGTTTIPNLAPNTYAGNLLDANNCSVALTETITEPGTQTLTIAATDNPCAGALQGTLTATYTNPTGNVTYDWNPGGIQPANRTSLASGVYTLTATDANSCSLTATATINEPAAPVMNVATTDASCFGGTGSAIAGPSNTNPPYNYTWSGGAGGNSQTVSPTPGNYTVTATDANGCNETASFSINSPPQLTISETHTDNLCFGDANGTITVTVGGGTPGTGYTYVWTQNVSTTNAATGLTAGSYTVTATDANNCSITQTTAIAQPTQLSVTATANGTLCFGENTGTVTAVGNGGITPYAYMLTPDGVNFEPSPTGQYVNQAAGTYTAIVTDDNQCTSTTTVTVTEPAQIVFTLAAADVNCFGSIDGQLSSVTSGGTPSYSYTFSNGTQNVSGNLGGLAPGSYTVTVTDFNSCTSSQSAVINEPPVVEVSVTPATAEVNLGEELNILASTNHNGGATYTWQPSFGLSCYDCANPVFNSNHTVTYQVTALTDSGCTGTSSITLTVIPNYDVFIPNAFTPNGDGENDTWKIFGNLPGLKQMNIMVFNRIGEKVFESNDINFQWDGLYNGKPAPHGIYIYAAQFVWLNDHSDADFRGSITLLR